MLNVLSHQGNANQNNPEFSPHQSEWLRLKTQETVGTGEDVDKEEHYSTAGGIGGPCYTTPGHINQRILEHEIRTHAPLSL